ncbi:MAG: metallophosphoesterase [Candidatus Hatepunaea meridiana]|nr:metallophosphoesterase [Candidatus Hatepunaea meridiana]
MLLRKTQLSITLISALILYCLISLNFVAASELKECPIRFAVIGDRTGGHVPGVYGDIIGEIELMKPDFVLTVGDMIEGYSDDYDKVSAEWTEYKTLITPLTSSIYHTPGNHDIWDEKSLELFRQQIGDNYYSFDYKGLHFIILDVSCINSSAELPDEQITWLEEDLNKHKDAAYTFVFFHKPFWIHTLGSSKSDEMHEIFKKHNVDAVFTGHYHTYFSGEYDGVIYTSIGSSGGGSLPLPNDLHYHFAWVTVDQRGINIAIIKKESVMPWDNFTAGNFNTLNELRNNGLGFENGVPILDGSAVKDYVYRLKVHNPEAGFSFKDTIRWKMPDNWMVEPMWLPVDIATGEDYVYDFKVSNTGSIYPVPEVSLSFHYEEGTKYDVKRMLQLSRETSCYKTKKSPKIDGQITEKCWSNPVTSFFGSDGKAMKTDSVYFYFSYDKKNLYLAAICNDEDISGLTTNAQDRDGAVFKDDCVGYFIQPDLEDDIVYQLYFNPNGTIYDVKFFKDEDGQWQTEREWSGKYKMKTFRDDKSWSIEVCIPLKQLGVKVKSDNKWGINFRRKQPRLKTNADWQIPIAFDPATLGVLVFK